VVRIGKTVPTYDFGNVIRPVPVQDLSLQIPAVSGLLYTPVFVNPTVLGALPGYYNAAYGLTATIAPTQHYYVSWGGYDGNGARGVQTGLQAAPTFNGYRFQIGETGTAWLLGPDNLPGAFAIGGWDQTGTLTASTPQGPIGQNGTHGVYASRRSGFGAGAGKTMPAGIRVCAIGRQQLADNDRGPICGARPDRIRGYSGPADGFARRRRCVVRPEWQSQSPAERNPIAAL